MEAELAKHDRLVQEFNEVSCVWMGRVEEDDGAVQVRTGFAKGNLAGQVNAMRRAAPGFYLTECFPCEDPRAALNNMHGLLSAAGLKFDRFPMPAP